MAEQGVEPLHVPSHPPGPRLCPRVRGAFPSPLRAVDPIVFYTIDAAADFPGRVVVHARSILHDGQSIAGTPSRFRHARTPTGNSRTQRREGQRVTRSARNCEQLLMAVAA